MKPCTECGSEGWIFPEGRPCPKCSTIYTIGGSGWIDEDGKPVLIGDTPDERRKKMKLVE